MSVTPEPATSSLVAKPHALLMSQYITGDDASCVVQEHQSPSEWLFHSEAVFLQL